MTTIEKILELAKEYATELEPDDKVARTFCENDFVGFLNRVLSSFYIVEKNAPLSDRLTDEERVKITAIYHNNLAESRYYTEKAGVCGSMCRADGYLRKREVNVVRVELLKSIFGASMFENDKNE